MAGSKKFSDLDSIQEARPSTGTMSLRTSSAVLQPVREPVPTSYDMITSRSQIADANCCENMFRKSK